MLYTCETELTFKRHVMASDTRPPNGGFFIIGVKILNLFIYTDESGVFDKNNNEYFVFGGIIYLSKEERDKGKYKYINVEKTLKHKYSNIELKASILSNKDKGKIFRSLNDTVKFATIVNQELVKDEIFHHKKSKQRFLDYIYKRLIKELLIKLSENGKLKLTDINNIYINCDEHTTSTDGKYELREALEAELKIGTFNFQYTCFYKPICEQLKSLEVKFLDSNKESLIRAADIVCNRVYYFATKRDVRDLKDKVIIFEYRKDYN